MRKFVYSTRETIELTYETEQFIAWNIICAILSPDKKVFCLDWQDNNIVLIFSTIYTVHNITDFIERERRRPNIISINAAIIRKAFGDEIKKKLHIPTFIDDYNYYMGSVNLAN